MITSLVKVTVDILCNNHKPVAPLSYPMTFGTTSLRWRIYFLHFVTSTVFQKAIMAATSSSFVCGLASRRMYILFQLVPQVLYQVNVGRLGWCLPPVNLILLQPSSCETCNMLRVVVLHETVVAVTKLIM